MDFFKNINSGMKYKCLFPNCNYETENRSQINYHHIVPKELGGKDGERNRIYLCPNCHSRIYVPNCTSGIHSINCDSSIIITNKLHSTSGVVLEYIENDETKYHFYRGGHGET